MAAIGARHIDLVVGRMGGVRPRPSPGSWLRLPGLGDSIGRARGSRHWCGREPTGSDSPCRRLALSSAVVGLFWLLRVIADTWPPGACASLGDAARLGRGVAPLRQCPPSRSGPARRGERATTRPRRLGKRPPRRSAQGSSRSRDVAVPHLRLLSSPTAQALRSERGSLATWALAIATFAAILGKISTSVSSAGISTNIRKQLAKFGTGSITTPSGYLAFVFIIFILAVCLFVCSQIGAARQEEAEERLETLLPCRSAGTAGSVDGCSSPRSRPPPSRCSPACSPGRVGRRPKGHSSRYLTNP